MKLTVNPLFNEVRLRAVPRSVQETLAAKGWGQDPSGYWFATATAANRKFAEQLAKSAHGAAEPPARGAGPSAKSAKGAAMPTSSKAPAAAKPAKGADKYRPMPPQPVRHEFQNTACAAHYVPVEDVHADPQRFQGRESEYSEASVAKLITDFDPMRLDPIVVWKDPKRGRYYVLSGHSRLEAHRRMGLPMIPVRVFQGSETEAVRFSKGFANRLATAETLREDVLTYKAYRDGRLAEGLPPASKQELKNLFGPRVDVLEELSNLNPNGKYMTLLGQSKEQQQQFPSLELRARWAGQLRRMYGEKLRNVHEDELFDFWLDKKRQALTKDELFDRVARKVGGMWWNPDNRLGLEVETSEAETRADTGPAAMRRREIAQEVQRLAAAQKTAQTKEAKAALNAEIRSLLEEDERLLRDINQVVRSQTGLFGPQLAELRQRMAALESALEIEGKRTYRTRWPQVMHTGQALVAPIALLVTRLQQVRADLYRAEDEARRQPMPSAPVISPGEQLRLTTGRTGAQAALFGTGQTYEINSEGRIEVGFGSKAEFQALPRETQDEVRRRFNWSPRRGLWVSRATQGSGSFQYAEQFLQRLGFALKGERQNYAEAYAEREMKRAERLDAELAPSGVAELTYEPVPRFASTWRYALPGEDDPGMREARRVADLHAALTADLVNKYGSVANAPVHLVRLAQRYLSIYREFTMKDGRVSERYPGSAYTGGSRYPVQAHYKAHGQVQDFYQREVVPAERAYKEAYQYGRPHQKEASSFTLREKAQQWRHAAKSARTDKARVERERTAQMFEAQAQAKDQASRQRGKAPISAELVRELGATHAEGYGRSYQPIKKINRSSLSLAAGGPSEYSHAHRIPYKHVRGLWTTFVNDAGETAFFEVWTRDSQMVQHYPGWRRQNELAADAAPNQPKPSRTRRKAAEPTPALTEEDIAALDAKYAAPDLQAASARWNERLREAFPADAAPAPRNPGEQLRLTPGRTGTQAALFGPRRRRYQKPALFGRYLKALKQPKPQGQEYRRQDGSYCYAQTGVPEWAKVVAEYMSEQMQARGYQLQSQYAAATGSLYLKFDKPGMRAYDVRIADHAGRGGEDLDLRSFADAARWAEQYNGFAFEPKGEARTIELPRTWLSDPKELGRVYQHPWTHKAFQLLAAPEAARNAKGAPLAKALVQFGEQSYTPHPLELLDPQSRYFRSSHS